MAIGCDGTNVNTGTKNGVIKRLEETLNSTLHWFVCMLHGNELPLRKIFTSLDGRTSGPKCFTGFIGKQLHNCEIRDIISFEPVAVPELQLINIDELSTDQKYLYEIYHAVSGGNFPEDLAKRNPSGLNHARWVTTANRILRLYVSVEEPSKNLKTLVKFVMTVYIPMWFQIKANPFVHSGAHHLFQSVKLMLQQSSEVQEIVFPVLQRNGYFAHPENILLAMISDTRPHVRELA